MMLPIIAFVAAASTTAQTTAPTSSSVEARRTLQRFARCTVSSKRELSRRALIEDWSIPMMIKRDVITPYCLDAGTLSARLAPMKAALGERLVVTDKNEVPPAQVAGAPGLAMRAADFEQVSKGADPPPLPKTSAENAIENHRKYVLLAQLGECVVRTDAANARALLDTEIGSNEEEAGAQRLVPALSKCAPSGEAAFLNAETVRNAVGISYYRMAMASRGVIWQPEGAPR